jgi:hypothetical protein
MKEIYMMAVAVIGFIIATPASAQDGDKGEERR